MEIKVHRLLDAEGVDGIKAIGEALVPAQKILADGKIKELWNGGKNKAEVLSYALSEHAQEVLDLLAVDAGEQVTAEEMSHLKTAAIYRWAFSLMNSEALQEVFTSQGQNEEAASSGSAAENIME